MVQRRDFFKSFLSYTLRVDKETDTNKVLLPYCDDTKKFANCKECDGECAKVCETNIIKIGVDKVPFLQLIDNGCTYCTKCAISCKKGVLDINSQSKIRAKITIDDTCMSKNGVMCFCCKDCCIDGAIMFSGLFNPTINDKCTNCGYCISKCPSNAIKVSNE